MPANRPVSSFLPGNVSGKLHRDSAEVRMRLRAQIFRAENAWGCIQVTRVNSIWICVFLWLRVSSDRPHPTVPFLRFGTHMPISVEVRDTPGWAMSLRFSLRCVCDMGFVVSHWALRIRAYSHSCDPSLFHHESIRLGFPRSRPRFAPLEFLFGSPSPLALSGGGVSAVVGASFIPPMCISMAPLSNPLPTSACVILFLAVRDIDRAASALAIRCPIAPRASIEHFGSMYVRSDISAKLRLKMMDRGDRIDNNIEMSPSAHR